MRHEHLMDQKKSRGSSLALLPTHSLLIAILLFLIPNQAASKAVPDDSQNSAGISESLGFPEGLIGLTSPIINPTPTISITSNTLSENATNSVDIIVDIPTATSSTSTSRIAISKREITPSGTVRALQQEPVDSVGPFMLSTLQKIGIGVGVPLTIICLALITYCCTKQHLIRSLRSRKRDDGSNAVGEGGFAELGTGRAEGWYSAGFDSSDRSKVPSSHHIGSSAGSKEVDAWDPLSGKQSAHASSGTLEDRHGIEISTGAIAMGASPVSESYLKAAREKRRPADLQPLTLSAPPQRPFTAGSQPSPGLFPHSGMNSPQIRQGHQSTMSSKSSSTLGLTAFFNPGHGHERHGSASTRISQKSRKGSTATMMTSNYEMEMATLSSASEPQFPITPRDFDASLSGGIFPGRIYRNSGYSCFDSEREEIATIKSHAYMPQPQTSSFIPPALSSPSLNARSRHRHSRTSSSGVNAANFVNSIPSVFSSPKVRPGTSPLAAGAKGKTVKKEDIRVINHETTYFDDRDDEEDEDIDSLHPKLPQTSSAKRHSRRHSAGMKRISKGQLSEVDGEEVWTDTEDEQDSDFVIAGGLGSRFGKKNLDTPA